MEDITLPQDYETAIKQMLAEIQHINKQMDHDRTDIERLKVETTVLKAETQLLKEQSCLLQAETQAILAKLKIGGRLNGWTKMSTLLFCF